MLEVRGLSFSYGDRPTLIDVSFRLTPGEWLGVLGPNGAGKTTLIRLLTRVAEPAGGQILLEGTPMTGRSLRETARQIALVPQETPWDFDFTCRDIVRMGRYPHLGLLQPERESDRHAVEEAMRQTGTWEFRERSIRDLSGGERQRVLLARALAQEAPILLLDEPAAHLDLRHQIDLLAHVRSLVRNRGACVLSTFHDVAQAATYASRLLLLRDGRVLADGPPEEILTAARIREAFEVDAFVGRHSETGGWVVHPR